MSQQTLLAQINSGKIRNLKIRMFFSHVLIPFFGIQLLLTKGLNLTTSTQIIVSLFFAALSLAFYLITSTQKHKKIKTRSLVFTPDGLTMRSQNQSLHEFPLHALHTEFIGWGPDVDLLLPALKIKGEGFPPITIGTMEAALSWSNYKKSVECVDYLIEDEASWLQLLGWIGKHESNL